METSEAPRTPAAATVAPIVRLRGVIKDYPIGDRYLRVLHGVDLDIPKGQFLVLMGPSGSGKSTLLHILGLLDVPTAGQYFLAGQRVDSLSDRALSRIRNRKIGFVFQGIHLLPRYDALRNVELPMMYAGIPWRERRRRAREALQRVGLEKRLRHRPSELSGGEAQRVAIARALVMRPEIILADEPTGNLDSRTEREIMDLFREIHQDGHTLIVVTHNPAVAEYAERVLLVRDGRVFPA